jgi:hypothetical protein
MIESILSPTHLVGATRMEPFPDSTLAQQPQLVRHTSERMQHERAPNL